jgi:ribosomal protein L11 methylase PrmA
MKLRPAATWQDGNVSAKVLGSYEDEVSYVFEAAIPHLRAMPNPVIVNIGCAEGYFAVGLAKAVPDATVWAIDIDPKSLELMLDNAVLNGVSNVIASTVVDEALKGHVDFVMCDCEGAEDLYLDPDKYPGLLKATMIVEMHGGMHTDQTRKLDDIILNRFKVTHHIEQVFQSGRNPNRSSILQAWHDDVRFLAMSEDRPCMMTWFCMLPRAE